MDLLHHVRFLLLPGGGQRGGLHRLRNRHVDALDPATGTRGWKFHTINRSAPPKRGWRGGLHRLRQWQPVRPQRRQRQLDVDLHQRKRRVDLSGGPNGRSASPPRQQRYALNVATGAKLWAFTTAGGTLSSAAVANGVVYIGTYRGVYALDAATGASLWSFTTAFEDESSSTVVNGMVFIGSDDHNLYAFGLRVGPAAPARPNLNSLHPTAIFANRMLAAPRDMWLRSDETDSSRPIWVQPAG